MLKIVAGERRGTAIETLEGLSTRPLRGRVREALFNILQFNVRGRRVLDLFAGSGAVGLEALSRGAESATFVESDAKAAGVVARNIAKLRYSDRARLVRDGLPEALGRLPGEKGYDLIFAMPPYHSGLAEAALEAMVRHEVLAPGAILVIELEAAETLAPPPGFVAAQRREYGVTHLHFLDWEPPT